MNLYMCMCITKRQSIIPLLKKGLPFNRKGEVFSNLFQDDEEHRHPGFINHVYTISMHVLINFVISWKHNYVCEEPEARILY